MALPTEIPVYHVSPFDGDDDDAFAVSEDLPGSTFSRDAIREEIARNIDNDWAEEAEPQSSSLEEHDTSVSTLDINGSTEPPHSTPVSPADTDDSVLPSEFSQISLSGGDTHDVDNSVDHGQSDAPYPSIVIDASESPSQRITFNLDHVDSDPHSHSPVEPSPTTSIRSLPPETMAHSSELQQPREVASVSTPSTPPLSVATNTHHSSASSEAPQKNGSTRPPATKLAGHRPARSTGPSMFEQVRSKTRPNFLPPKPKAEDEKHLADWQSMMKLSRIAGSSIYLLMIMSFNFIF